MTDRATIDELAARLRELFGSSSNVRLVSRSKRLFASLYEFEITSNDIRQNIITKRIHSAREVNAQLSLTERAAAIRHLLPKADPVGREASALKSMESHFTKLADSRFGAVRVLGQWLDGAVVVMEKSFDPTLNRLLRNAAIHRGDRAISTAFRNAGAWLREFHSIHTVDLSDLSGQFAEDISKLCECLADEPSFCRIRHKIQSQLLHSARCAMDESMSVVILHEDFAPRNIFVGPTGRVSAIDTLADSTGSAYADLGQFLFNVRMSKIQRVTRGLAFGQRRLARLEHELLDGYFGADRLSVDLVNLAQARALLIRWAAQHVCENEPETGHFYATELQRLCHELERSLESITYELNRGRPQYKFLRTDGHRFSSIHWYTSGDVADVVVKVARDPRMPADRSQSYADRPRLVPLIPSEHEIRCEYEALLRTQRHIEATDAQGIGSVGVHGFLPVQEAMVTEAVSSPTLSDVLKTGQTIDLRLACQRAGLWLRTFHGLPESSDVVCRNATRAQFCESIDQFSSFLADRGISQTWLEAINRRVFACAVDHLPSDLPLGTNHGDYAPHNMFVSADATIMAYDTTAAWRTAIYEDIARFLFLARRYPGHSNEREAWCLEGYFGSEPIPHAAVKLFMIQVMFDEWCSVAFSPLRAKGLRRLAKSARLKWRSRSYRREIERLLRDIEATVSREIVIDPTLRRARSVAPCQ